MGGIKISMKLFLALALLSSPAFAAPIWQQSVSQKVTLGVRDKFGELGKYTAKFVVTTQLGEIYTRTIEVPKGDFGGNFGYVEFPSSQFKSEGREAPPNADPGRIYSWEVQVGGRSVTSGKFTFGMQID